MERPLSLEEAKAMFKLEDTHAKRSRHRPSKGRILMISEHADPIARPGSKEVGGQNVYVYHLARELGRLGWDVDVYTRWDNAAKRQTVTFGRRARVIRVKCGPKHYVVRDTLYDYLPEFADNIVAYKREHGLEYDLIHSHYWMSGWIGLKLRSLWDIPLVTTYHSLGKVRHEALKAMKEIGPHNNFFEFRTHWELELAEKSDLILSTSPYEVEDIRKYYQPRQMQVAVTPIGIDPALFHPIQKDIARRKIGEPPERKLLLYVGRIEWRKGIETLIKSMAILRASPDLAGKDLRLLIVGRKSGPERTEVSRLQLLAQQLGVADLVVFKGSADRSQVRTYYSAADVCVVPSYYEPFGIVPLEALTCRCPVIASRVGGLQYTVQDGQNGFLVPPQDPAAIAKHAEEILTGRSTIQEKVNRFAELVIPTKWHWDKIAREVESDYQETMERRRSAKLSQTYEAPYENRALSPA